MWYLYADAAHIRAFTVCCCVCRCDTRHVVSGRYLLFDGHFEVIRGHINEGILTWDTHGWARL